MPCSAAKKKKRERKVLLHIQFFYECICYCCLVAKMCLALRDHMDCGPPGSSVHGILHWSGLPFPSPGNLPDPRIKPKSPAFQVDSLSLSHHGSPMNVYTYLLFAKHSMVCSDSDTCTVFKELTVRVRAGTWWPWSGTSALRAGSRMWRKDTG